MSARYAGSKISATVTPGGRNWKNSPGRFRDGVPVGCGRYPPSLTTVQSGSVDIVIMAASFTGWGKVKSEWVQAGVNSTELAWLLSLKRAYKTKPKAFIVILIYCPTQDSKTCNPMNSKFRYCG